MFLESRLLNITLVAVTSVMWQLFWATCKGPRIHNQRIFEYIRRPHVGVARKSYVSLKRPERPKQRMPTRAAWPRGCLSSSQSRRLPMMAEQRERSVLSSEPKEEDGERNSVSYSTFEGMKRGGMRRRRDSQHTGGSNNDKLILCVYVIGWGLRKRYQNCGIWEYKISRRVLPFPF